MVERLWRQLLLLQVQLLLLLLLLQLVMMVMVMLMIPGVATIPFIVLKALVIMREHRACDDRLL